MKYDGFLNTISLKFNSLFSEISVGYNFDYGDEFEIALCKTLRVLLPSKYGICRGFVVTLDGNRAGDDIIIFDCENFPTLRLLEDNAYAQKQQIPIEAVYAYIEAKHCLNLDGDDGQSLSKALKQVSDIKALKREKVALCKIDNMLTLHGYKANCQEYWPNYRNPMYTAIIAREVRQKKTSKKLMDSAELFSNLNVGLNILSASYLFNPDIIIPDLIIAGEDIVCLPAVNTQIESPFFIPKTSRLAPLNTNKLSFGIGISSMLYAFDYIKLGEIHWPTVIADGLGLEVHND